MGLQLEVDLRGKVRNISDQSIKNEPYMPLYEAISNSIHAIQETRLEEGLIRIKIFRQKPVQGRAGRTDPIIHFHVIDNGIGFTNENYKAFCTSETTRKMKIGGKGVGRFTWLKAFDSVEIQSVFEQDRIFYKREITFNLESGITQTELGPAEATNGTIVKLLGFKDKYRTLENAYKSSDKIAQRIMEHFLPYFILETNPRIEIHETTSNEIIDLDTRFEDLKKDISSFPIKIKKIPFTLYHVKLKDTYNYMNKIAYCGHSREVAHDTIDFHGQTSLTDEKGDTFYYACYVESEYLNKNVSDSRDSFSIPSTENDLRNYISDTPVSLERIKNEVIKQIKLILSPFFRDINAKKCSLFENFLKETPYARLTFTKFKDQILEDIKVNHTNKDINEIFYKYKGRSEFSCLEETREVLKTNEEKAKIAETIKAVMEKIGETQKDQLVQYMVFRRCIIDLFSKAISCNTSDKIPREAKIHNLIFPMRKDSNEVDEKSMNLWILDEKLAYHTYACSDQPLDEIIEDEGSKNRPDIIICQNQIEGVVQSIAIFELKRPHRDDNFDPIDQLYKYITIIREKEAIKDFHLRVNESTLFFCYAICDITPGIKKVISNHDLIPLPLDAGYFKYNKRHNAFVEIRPYDRILEDVIHRHKMFFEKLGISNH